MLNKFFIFIVALSLYAQSAFALEQQEVLVSDLPAFSQNTIGVKTAFDAHIFDGSKLSDVSAILSKMKTKTFTPASLNIITQLLKQDITGGSFEEDGTQNTFFVERLNTLFALGQWADVAELLQEIPDKDITDEITEIKINTQLLKGDDTNACALIENSEIPYYSDKMRTVCFLMKEESEKANLSFDIYRENADEKDPLFAVLADIVLNEIALEIPADSILQPQHVFLFASCKKDMKNLADQMIGVRKALADLPQTEIPLRLNAVQSLVLSADELERIYKLPLLKEDPESQPYLKRASLFRSFLEAQDNEMQKIQALSALLENARVHKQTLFVAPLLEKMLSHVQPSAENADLAFDAVQVYAVQNDTKMAQQWYEVLSDAKPIRYQKQALLLVPLMNHLGADVPRDTPQKIKEFCPDEKACPYFWYMYPYQTFDRTLGVDGQNIQDEFALDSKKSDSVKEDIPFAYMRDTDSKKGENILKALSDLQQTSDLKKREKLLLFLKTLVPEEIFKPLEREEMIY